MRLRKGTKPMCPEKLKPTSFQGSCSSSEQTPRRREGTLLITAFCRKSCYVEEAFLAVKLLASGVESSRIETFRRSPCQHCDALLVMQQLLN